MADKIIGIPKKGLIHPIRKITEPEEWEFVLHDHDAKRAGKHFDLRIGDPKTGHGHSWAMKYWPKPGEKRLAVQQSTHSIPYFDWSGTIEEGYGAGEVAIAKRGKAKLLKATPTQITFALGAHELYSLNSMGEREKNSWLLLNRTPKE